MTCTSQRKGPAEVAASPSHGSNIPAKGKPMNTATDTTTEPITATFDAGRLDDMDIDARCAVYDAFHLAAEILHGVMLQPRSQRTSEQNGASRIISELVEFFGLAMDVLVARERERREATPAENERHLFLLLRHEARMADDLAVLAAMATQFVVQQQEVEWDARHARKAVSA